MTIHFRADQVVSGLALTFLGTGLARVLGEGLRDRRDRDAADAHHPGAVATSRPRADLLHATRASWPTSATCWCPVAWFWIDRTRPGLHLRAVGE